MKGLVAFHMHPAANWISHLVWCNVATTSNSVNRTQDTAQQGLHIVSSQHNPEAPDAPAGAVASQLILYPLAHRRHPPAKTSAWSFLGLNSRMLSAKAHAVFSSAG